MKLTLVNDGQGFFDIKEFPGQKGMFVCKKALKNLNFDIKKEELSLEISSEDNGGKQVTFDQWFGSAHYKGDTSLFGVSVPLGISKLLTENFPGAINLWIKEVK